MKANQNLCQNQFMLILFFFSEISFNIYKYLATLKYKFLFKDKPSDKNYFLTMYTTIFFFEKHSSAIIYYLVQSYPVLGSLYRPHLAPVFGLSLKNFIPYMSYLLKNILCETFLTIKPF
jgi:hypothetical protein